MEATIRTDKGEINLDLFEEIAPVTVASFANLARSGFYEGLSFHRVIENFMIQGGCPLGTGTGGPGYQFEDECSAAAKHDKPGVLSMANAGPGTNGSQFFITHLPTPWLDGKHTVFGQTKSDADVATVNSIEKGDRIETIEIGGDIDEHLAKFADRIEGWNRALESES